MLRRAYHIRIHDYIGTCLSYGVKGHRMEGWVVYVMKSVRPQGTDIDIDVFVEILLLFFYCFSLMLFNGFGCSTFPLTNILPFGCFVLFVREFGLLGFTSYVVARGGYW